MSWSNTQPVAAVKASKRLGLLEWRRYVYGGPLACGFGSLLVHLSLKRYAQHSLPSMDILTIASDNDVDETRKSARLATENFMMILVCWRKRLLQNGGKVGLWQPACGNNGSASDDFASTNDEKRPKKREV